MRIHTSRRQSKPSARPSSDPLDTIGAVQPTDLVPHSTGPEAPEPVGIRVPEDEVQRDHQPSMEEYVKRIEASAARSRAESGGQAAVGVPRGRVASVPETPERQRLRALRKKQRQLAAKPSGPWYRRRRSWFIIGMVIPLLFVIGATIYVLNIVRLSVDAYGDINQERVDRTRWTVNSEGTPVPMATSQVEAALPDWNNEEPFNILLLGVDIREGDDDPPRSDTAIVVHIDPGTDEVAMMSIPRDLMVFIPGFGEDKFNAAYPIGEANAEEIPGGGPTLVAQTVEANFSVPIHYFATIDFDGFRRVVDRVGGVVVDVDYMLSDNQYPTDDLRLTRVYFPTGLQKLDGEAALQYVRTRHADSDFGRADRQQQVLMAIREQAP